VLETAVRIPSQAPVAIEQPADLLETFIVARRARYVVRLDGPHGDQSPA